MTVQQVYEEMARLAPPAMAESWDNVGVLVDCGKSFGAILVALDITPEVVREASERGCGLIVSHHPVIFSPLKTLSTQDVPFQLVQAGISAICMHTNLDAAEGGVNDVLAGLFDIQDVQPFADGCGRIGTVEETSVEALAARCKTVLGQYIAEPASGERVQVKFADVGHPVKRLAVISGAGGSLFEDALALGADCLLTGEANHHHACDAKRLGMSLIAAGHYATEFPVVFALAERLRKDLPEMQVLTAAQNRDPYLYL
jgi:dinuclear metal center YbgI/SA1388 family protein